MNESMRVAAIQTLAGGDVAENLAKAAMRVGEAAAQGAQLILLPEYFGILGAKATDKLAAKEVEGVGPQQEFLARMAREHGAIVVGGSVPMASADPGRVRSACLVYGPDGARIARYDKIHLFRFAKGTEDYDETRTIAPGDEVVSFDAPCGKVGLSICYDVRFPELYRALGDCTLLLVPAAFTATTGAAHWELLLRTRAVENQCYVLAAAQGGLHPNGRRTWGHSMLIDPWGTIVASLDDGLGVVVGDVEPSCIAEVRQQLPALTHRVM